MTPRRRHLTADAEPTADPGVRTLTAGRLACLACLVCLTWFAAGGCGAGSTPVVDRSAFSARITERVGITAAQGRCVTARVYEHYDEAEITVIHRQGAGALPPERWRHYVQAIAACVLAGGAGGT